MENQPKNSSKEKAMFGRAATLKWQAIGCIGSFIIFTVVLAVITGGRFGIGFLIPMLIGVWLARYMYRRNMEKRLGRKLRGDHELTSILPGWKLPQKIRILLATANKTLRLLLREHTATRWGAPLS